MNYIIKEMDNMVCITNNSNNDVIQKPSRKEAWEYISSVYDKSKDNTITISSDMLPIRYWLSYMMNIGFISRKPWYLESKI